MEYRSFGMAPDENPEQGKLDPMFQNLGITYMIYAAFGLVAWFFVRNFVQETKGRTLEEMSY